jgi:hypothetical protein
MFVNNRQKEKEQTVTGFQILCLLATLSKNLIKYFISLELIDLTKYKLTDKGLEIPGATEALKKSSELYPTYDDLLKRRNDHFKVKEKLRLMFL